MARKKQPVKDEFEFEKYAEILYKQRRIKKRGIIIGISIAVAIFITFAFIKNLLELLVYVNLINKLGGNAWLPLNFLATMTLLYIVIVAIMVKILAGMISYED